MTPDRTSTLRELDHRVNDGIDVRLLWSSDDDRLVVAVCDERTSETFRLEIADAADALDAFHHPYAYAVPHGARPQQTPVTT